MPAVSIEQQIACLKREIAMRKNVYPKWVQSKRMTKEEADTEIERMTAALHTLMAFEWFATNCLRRDSLIVVDGHEIRCNAWAISSAGDDLLDVISKARAAGAH